MKPRLFGALLLVGLLSSTSDSFARPPRQHAERGVIETVDHAANSFTIISGKDAARRTFIWKNGTSFRQKSPQPDASWISRLFSLGEKTTAESLQPGRSVRFYYRKELGRHVVRSVTILAALDQSCGCCPRSASVTTPTESLPL
jgi:hypothetical protein